MAVTLSRKSLVSGARVGSAACAICRAMIFFAVTQASPVIVGQPQWHVDVEDIEQFDEVVRPSGRDGAGAHGVFEGQVPADDPGEQFAEVA